MIDIKPHHMAGRFTLQTTCEDGIISQELQSIQEGHVERITKWVCDTKEQGIKDALIKMGWTPPKGDKTEEGGNKDA